MTIHAALFGTACTIVLMLLVSVDLWPLLLLDAAWVVGVVWKE